MAGLFFIGKILFNLARRGFTDVVNLSQQKMFLLSFLKLC